MSNIPLLTLKQRLELAIKKVLEHKNQGEGS